MSAPTQAAAPAPGRTGGWRRHRTALLVTAAALLAIGLVALTAGPPSTTSDLDPDNPGPAGARAAARVLVDRGVDVRVVRDADALEGETIGPDTLVVVTSTERLGDSTGERLLEHVGAGSLVVVDAGPAAVRTLGADASPAVVRPDGAVAAGCDDPALAGLRLEVDQARAYAGDGCFAVDDGVLVSQPRPGLTLLGAGAALTNDQVLRGDNAAVVLRLLGQRERLVWYVPDLADLVAADGVGVESLLPTWLRPSLLLVGLAAVALVLWRSRRLGPLAVEPLPVVVRALETTRSRGRLYRRAGDRAHAAEALRSATRRRVAERLAVPSTDPDTVVAHLASRLDRPTPGLAALLGSRAPAPATDDDLIALAGSLAALEEEVRHP